MTSRPLIVMTGAAGNLGRSIAAALLDRYRVVGIDKAAEPADFPILKADLTSDASTQEALEEIRGGHGARIASMLHLAAYFDFTGEEHPLYRKLNVEGTRRLIEALDPFDIEQFVLAGTMLVHAPARPGERIDEDSPIGPQWAYPRSKAAAERVVREHAGAIPTVLLRLAGVYDEETVVPTLAHQIARIRERDFQSHLYPGDPRAGQAMLHREDMIDAFRRTVDRRAEIPPGTAILIGEPDAPSYEELQDEIGCLIHGREHWATLRVPKPLAAAGAWAQEKLEPIIPDSIDKGEEPFVKPFMVRMADDHYALDISRARLLLGWEPRHRLRDELPAIIEALRRDPAGWYRRNDVPLPEDLRGE